MFSVRLILAAVVLAVTATPAQARADWLLIPYAGVRFGGSTALLVPESAVENRTYTLGVSVVRMGAGIFGLESDLGLTPGFFEATDEALVKSSVTSFGGNLILTLPLSVTRESLRPYVLAGGGLLRVSLGDLANILVIESTMPAVTLGAGAIGYFSDSTGVRFDLRLHRSLGQGDDELVRPGHRLRYWRGTIGIIRRF